MTRFKNYKIYVLLLFLLLLAIPLSNITNCRISSIFSAPVVVKHDVYYQNRAIVLLYHNFSKRECGTAITPARFAQHLDMLRTEGFNIVSLNDVVAFVEQKKPLPPNAIAITMDDGYESNYTEAYPQLKKKNWPATVFIAVANMGPNKSAGLGNKWLDWPNIIKLSQDTIMIGSHSYDGHKFLTGTYPKGDAWFTTKLTGEDQAAYEKRIYDNLLLSREILEQKLNTPVEHFAHPFGMYNDTVIAMAKKAGYKYIWTTRRDAITADSSLDSLGRVSVGIGGTTPEQLEKIIIEIGQKK